MKKRAEAKRVGTVCGAYYWAKCAMPDFHVGKEHREASPDTEAELRALRRVARAAFDVDARHAGVMLKVDVELRRALAAFTKATLAALSKRGGR